jgi:hypothetical protein
MDVRWQHDPLLGDCEDFISWALDPYLGKQPGEGWLLLFVGISALLEKHSAELNEGAFIEIVSTGVLSLEFPVSSDGSAASAIDHNQTKVMDNQKSIGVRPPRSIEH